MATFQKRGLSWRAIIRKAGIVQSKTFPTKTAAQAWASNKEAEILEKHAINQSRPYKTPVGLKSEADIVRDSIPSEAMSGVYFLLLDNRVMYVGKSVDMYCRISEHRTKGRKFTHFSVIPCPPEDLAELESKYILAFAPEGNRGRYGKLVYSVSESKLQEIKDSVKSVST